MKTKYYKTDRGRLFAVEGGESGVSEPVQKIEYEAAYDAAKYCGPDCTIPHEHVRKVDGPEYPHTLPKIVKHNVSNTKLS